MKIRCLRYSPSHIQNTSRMRLCMWPSPSTRNAMKSCWPRSRKENCNDMVMWQGPEAYPGFHLHSVEQTHWDTGLGECVCMRARGCVCVCVKEREREFVCVCVCIISGYLHIVMYIYIHVCNSQSWERVCVCVCVIVSGYVHIIMYICMHECNSQSSLL